MKNSNRIPAGIICIMLLTSLFFSGCKKDSTTPNNLSPDDAADAITYTTTSSTGGLSAQVASAASYSYTQGFYKTNNNTQTLSLTCGVPFDTAISLIYTGATTASYNCQLVYLLLCSDTVSESLSMSGSYSGNYNAPRLQSTNTGNRNWTITGLDSNTSDPYIFNGTFTRTGTHISKVRNQYTYTVNMTITVTNLTVSKTTYLITGGSGSVTMTGNVSNGNSYSYNGNIIFNGNGTATLTINGNTYTITL